MKTNNNDLLGDLVKRTNEVQNALNEIRNATLDHLNHKTNKEIWSALECIEHLNRYYRFYLPEIEEKLTGSSKKGDVFKSGWLGNYFAKSMLPKEKLNKMKTFKAMDPAGSNLGGEVLSEFDRHQKKMLELLEQASEKDLTKIRTAISISKLIKLRLGDTFRVVIYHNQRHIIQAKRAVELALKI